MTTLADQVSTNLNFFHLWTKLSKLSIETSQGGLEVVVGTPPNKLLSEDQAGREEYVLPATTEDGWTIRQWDETFKAIETATGEAPSRIVMAMVTSDGTIVYYFVNSGLTKPRKNN